MRGVAVVVEAGDEEARDAVDWEASLERALGVAGTTVCIDAVEEREDEDEVDGVGEYGRGDERDGDNGVRAGTGVGGRRAAIACAYCASSEDLKLWGKTE